MKDKEKAAFSREELARYFERLAQGIREGYHTVRGKRFPVPEKIKTKLRTKEKKGKLSHRVEFEWSTLEGYEPAEKEKIGLWKDSFKSVKKRLAASMKKLSGEAEGGTVPDAALLASFRRDSEKFAAMADPDWQEEMNEYMDHLENLEKAAEEGRLEAVRHELRDLENKTRSCHREYK